MTRRDFLRGSLAATLLPGLQSAPQAPPDSTRRGDPLYDPSVVQERALTTAADNDPVVQAVERRLKCTCGCNLDIYICRTTDFTCSYSPVLHREVVALLAAGASPDAVVAAFVDKYGESTLMAPPPQGFNLAGYLLPGVLVTAVGLLLAWVIARRSRRPEGQLAAVTPGRLEEALPTDRLPDLPPIPNPGADERLRKALQEVED